MARSSIPVADAVKVYSALVLNEGLDDMQLSPLVGGVDAVIRRYDDLRNATGGSVRVPLRRNLVSRGVVDDANVEDQAESLRVLYFTQNIKARRHAVQIDGPLTGQISQVDLLKEATPALRDWLAGVTEYDLIKALSCLSNSELSWTTDGTNYYSPKASRRIIGGQTVGSSSTAAVLETGLTDATLDDTSSGNRFGPEVIDLAVRKMKVAKIAPAKVGGDTVYVLLAHQLQIKSLWQCYTWQQAIIHGEVRGRDNPNFRAKADVRVVGIWHDCLILESNMIETRLGAGGTAATEYFESSDVVYSGTTAARALLMGRGAGVLAWAQYPQLTPGKYDLDTKDALVAKVVYGPGQVSFATNSGAQEAFASMVIDTVVIPD